MKILGFLLASIVWLWFVYSLSLALFQAAKTGIAQTPMVKYAYRKQPEKFVLTVLVQVMFWLGLVGWWLNGAWNLIEKLLH